MNNLIKITAGLDIGNGYVKGTVCFNGKFEKQHNIDLPSCVASVACPIDIPPQSVKEEVEGLYNRASVSFNSAIVTSSSSLSTARAYLGERGISSGKPLIAFDINDGRSKAEQELSGVLVLSIVASAAVQEHFANAGKLPDETLKVECNAALALPIDEYRNFRDTFAEIFTKTKHVVSFHNFEQPVTVELMFTDVKVIAEGASAIFAIGQRGEKFVNLMLAEVRQNGIKLDGITAADIIESGGVLGVDIGEGTVNFPAFTNGNFNTDYSGTHPEGYGTVLEASIEPLAAQKAIFRSRKTLAEFLHKRPNNLNRQRHENVKAIVDAQSVAFCHGVIRKFKELFRLADGQIEVVYVYGGGATPLKPWLYPQLLEALKEFDGNSELPVLYLDSRYSRFLNREGLFQLAERHAPDKSKK